MFVFAHHISASSPQPFPSASGLDTSLVTPGSGGAITFTFLAIALVILIFSMNRHIKKVNFEEKPQD